MHVILLHFLLFFHSSSFFFVVLVSIYLFSHGILYTFVTQFYNLEYQCSHYVMIHFTKKSVNETSFLKLLINKHRIDRNPSFFLTKTNQKEYFNL